MTKDLFDENGKLRLPAGWQEERERREALRKAAIEMGNVVTYARRDSRDNTKLVLHVPGTPQSAKLIALAKWANEVCEGNGVGARVRGSPFTPVLEINVGGIRPRINLWVNSFLTAAERALLEELETILVFGSDDGRTDVSA